MNQLLAVFDMDLLRTLVSELGIGVLVMAWMEVRKVRRENARLRRHLAEKWRIYAMVTANLDERAMVSMHVVDATEKE